MSISSAITGLQNAKSAIISAITGKGVTVPIGSKFADLANLISTVSGGAPSTIVAGNTPVLYPLTNIKRATSAIALTASGISITIPTAGTYRFKWGTYGYSSSYQVRSRLYRNGTAVGTEIVASGPVQSSLDLACSAGDTVELYVRGYSYMGTYGEVGGLAACINWNNGF